MRVLIDTHVFISYFLHPQGTGTIQEIFSALIQERFTLLLPEALLEEVLITVANKPRVAKRIPPQEFKAFIAILRELGEAIPEIKEPIPVVTRDLKDDYLLAYALVGAANYLVTGDDDLLVLQGQIEGVEVVTPRQFMDVLSPPRMMNEYLAKEGCLGANLG